MPLLPPAPDRDHRLLLDLVREEAPLPREPGGASWRRVLQRARAHGVAPLVLSRLAELPPGTLDEELAAEIVAARRGWTARHLIQEKELLRASEILAGEGIRPLVLKGPAVGRMAYPDPSLRASADIDLLIPAERRRDAVEALAGAGYTVLRRYPDWFHYHDVLRSPSGAIVEMHWALARPDALYRLDASGFLERGLTLEHPAPVTWSAPGDLLLHGASQALLEGYDRLVRLVDVDRLLRRCGQGAEMDGVVERARHSRLAGSTWLLLTLAHELLDTPVASLAGPLRPGRGVRLGLRSLAPARALLTGFALRYTILQQLYAVWLADDASRRVRAAVRIVRLPSLRIAFRRRPPARGLRLGGVPHRLGNLLKLAAYQILCLARLAMAGDRAGGARDHAGSRRR